MSRGPGEVMRKVLDFTIAMKYEYGACLTYRGLATCVYEAESPTRAQLSAVARAARRLEQDGLIEIYAYADDQREKVVGLSPWADLAFLVLQQGGPLSDTTTGYAGLVDLAQAGKELVELGLVEGRQHGRRIDPRNRPLVVDGVRDDGAPVVRRPLPVARGG